MAAYLQRKLKDATGFDYTVFVRSGIGRQFVDIDIDETTMTDASYAALNAFKSKYNLRSDTSVFSTFMNLEQGGTFWYNYLVTDLVGVYVIRHNLTGTAE